MDHHSYNNILYELSKHGIIKYSYINDHVSRLLLIHYIELNFVPLYKIIRNHPADHGYGNFEIGITSLYKDIIKKNKVIFLLNVSKSWNFPKEISIHICKLFWDVINK